MSTCFHRNRLNECAIIGLGEICPGIDPTICAAWRETNVPCPVCIMESEGEIRFLLENKYDELFYCEECSRRFTRRELINEYSTAAKFLAKVWSEMLDGMNKIKNIADKAMQKAEVKF